MIFASRRSESHRYSCARSFLNSAQRVLDGVQVQLQSTGIVSVSVVAGSITSDAVELEDTAIPGHADRVIEIDTIGDPNELDTERRAPREGPK